MYNNILYKCNEPIKLMHFIEKPILFLLDDDTPVMSEREKIVMMIFTGEMIKNY